MIIAAVGSAAFRSVAFGCRAVVEAVCVSVLLRIDGGLRVGFVSLPDSNSGGDGAGTCEQSRADFFEKVSRHVFGGGVVGEDEQAAGGDHLQCVDGV